ncbi:DUF488 domain-containing protein [Paraburkholderia sp. LEh10]|uniref:DUF488 domain-containing protein n=1 Tax=Paraburkholderia sp. LEh10 TaxID=2821353 RepID=UPI001AE9B742|nr:DUF488 domain-containing protein [Paraburkholderia sp. LEh10]MBP0590484.1 DUF488 domain-containing protein [Paraburkholderia sp. LEh10]
MTLFTIGYEGLDINDFVSLLDHHEIETVVDIREFPLSRKPGFSKTALTNLLNLSGFEYVHMVDLGCPKPVRNRYREDGDWSQYKRGFSSYLKTQATAIEELSNLAETSACALLCYEADYNHCHRMMVAAAVRSHCGADVEHILSSTKTARVADRQRSFA